MSLKIYDLYDLAAVTEVGSVSTGAEQHQYAVKIGSYIYAPGIIWLHPELSSMKVIDVFDPANPILVGTIPFIGSVKRRNGKLFGFSSIGPEVYAYSLADPENPQLEASSTVPLPAPSTSLNLFYMSNPVASWVGDYLIGVTHGSAGQYNGVRALYFPVN